MLRQEAKVSVLVRNPHLSVGLEHAMSVSVLDTIRSRSSDRPNLNFAASHHGAVDVCEMARWHLVESFFMDD